VPTPKKASKANHVGRHGREHHGEGFNVAADITKASIYKASFEGR
jgi:hypothetical protein